MSQYSIFINIDNDYQTNKKNYFLVIFPPHFYSLVRLWIHSLNTTFKKKFEPIFIVSNRDEMIIKNNFIEIKNKKNQGRNLIECFSERDFNKIISKTKEVDKLIINLFKKQKNVFILPYTSSGLFLNKKITYLSTNPQISEYFDKKINGYKIFKQLKINPSPFKAIRYYSSLFFYKKPFFLTGMYSSGSRNSSIIYNNVDLIRLFRKFTNENQKLPFVHVKFIKKIKYFPSVHAYISNNKNIQIITISDQIIDFQGKYCGGIVPSSLSKEIRDTISKRTLKVGNYLGKKGFLGFYCVDFLIDSKNKIYATDINPRRSDTYFAISYLYNKQKINISQSEINTLTKKSYQQKIKDLNLNRYFGYLAINSDNRIYFKEYKNTIKNLKINMFYKINNIIKGGKAGYFYTYENSLYLLQKKMHYISSILDKNYFKKNDFSKNIFKKITRSFIVVNKILYTDILKFLYKKF